MHSSLAVTMEGIPLGLAAVKFWTRKKFKGTAALKKKINPTRVPIEKKESIRWLENMKQATELLAEPGRCVHIGDRESDIFELFCTAQELGTHFLVRTCVDRLAGGGHTPGHSVVRLASGGARLTFAGDAVFQVGFDHPDWHNGFEYDPEEAARVRIRLLRELAPLTNSKNWVERTIVYRIPEALIRRSWAILARR